MKKILHLLFGLIIFFSCESDDNVSVNSPISVYEIMNREWKLDSLTSGFNPGVYSYPAYDARLKFEITDTFLNSIGVSGNDNSGAMILSNANIYGNAELDEGRIDFVLYEPYFDYLNIDMEIEDIDNIGISDEEFVIVTDSFQFPIRFYVDGISLERMILIGDGFAGDTTFYYSSVD